MSVIEQQFEERQTRSQISRDGEKLLQLAENLQDRCERYERQMFLYDFIVPLASIGIAILGSLAFNYYSASDTLTAIFLGIAGLFYAACGLGFFWFLRRWLLRLRNREKRTLHSIVDMLREIEPALADQENMSALERAEFKIRLARFDIGPESQSSASNR